MKPNHEIRSKAKAQGVFLWEIAENLNISEPTMTRKMRKAIPPDEKANIFNIIDSIAERKAVAAE